MTGYVFGLALTLAGALVGLAGVRRRVDDAMFFGGMALVGGWRALRWSDEAKRNALASSYTPRRSFVTVRVLTVTVRVFINASKYYARETVGARRPRKSSPISAPYWPWVRGNYRRRHSETTWEGGVGDGGGVGAGVGDGRGVA